MSPVSQRPPSPDASIAPTDITNQTGYATHRFRSELRYQLSRMGLHRMDQQWGRPAHYVPHEPGPAPQEGSSLGMSVSQQSSIPLLEWDSGVSSRAEHALDFAQQRPSTAPPTTRAGTTRAAAPRHDEVVLYYMPSFRRTRSPRARPPPAGQRQLGFGGHQILAKGREKGNAKGPAYSFRPQFVYGTNVNLEDTPGPGAYDLCKY